MKNRLTGKSSDLRFVLFKGQTSGPYSRMGRHLIMTNSKTTSLRRCSPDFPKKIHLQHGKMNALRDPENI